MMCFCTMSAVLCALILVIDHILAQFGLEHKWVLDQLFSIVTLLAFFTQFALDFNAVAHCWFVIPAIYGVNWSSTFVLEG